MEDFSDYASIFSWLPNCTYDLRTSNNSRRCPIVLAVFLATAAFLLIYYMLRIAFGKGFKRLRSRFVLRRKDENPNREEYKIPSEPERLWSKFEVEENSYPSFFSATISRPK